MICMCEFSGCCKFYILKMIDLFLKDLLYFFGFFKKVFIVMLCLIYVCLLYMYYVVGEYIV